MSVDSEQSHYNKIYVFEAARYLGLHENDTQNTVNILLGSHKYMFLQTQCANLKRLMGHIWPRGRSLSPCAAARGSGKNYLNEHKTVNQTSGSENIFFRKEGSKLYSYSAGLRYKLLNGSAKVSAFPSVCFTVTLLGLQCPIMSVSLLWATAHTYCHCMIRCIDSLLSD